MSQCVAPGRGRGEPGKERWPFELRRDTSGPDPKSAGTLSMRRLGTGPFWRLCRGDARGTRRSDQDLRDRHRRSGYGQSWGMRLRRRLDPRCHAQARRGLVRSAAASGARDAPHGPALTIPPPSRQCTLRARQRRCSARDGTVPAGRPPGSRPAHATPRAPHPAARARRRS
jgi:hypothetical protein